MTPTEHSAVAEAIAALEPLEKAIAEARTNGHLAIRFVGDEYYGVVERAFASLRALASAPSEAPKPPGDWRPIETAPKDETCVLAYVPLVEHVLLRWSRIQHKWIFQWGLDDWISFYPTHWTPLPKPPGQEPGGDPGVGRGEGREYRNPRNVALDQGYGRPTPSEAPKPQGQEPGGDPGVGRITELETLNAGLSDKVRNLTTLLDQQLGTPCEEIRHAQEVEKLQALALPTADREAIREALKEALRRAERPRLYPLTDAAQIAKLTAALALIEER